MSNKKPKTVQTELSVEKFINSITEESKKADCFKLIELIREVSGFEPKLWGTSIIGFGFYHYKYESGREGDAPLVAFSPRKSEIALYLSSSIPEREELLQKLGKHKTAKACVYLKTLEGVSQDVLKKLIERSLQHVKRLHAY